jgi:hypothetical protein
MGITYLSCVYVYVKLDSLVLFDGLWEYNGTVRQYDEVPQTYLKGWVLD